MCYADVKKKKKQFIKETILDSMIFKLSRYFGKHVREVWKKCLHVWVREELVMCRSAFDWLIRLRRTILLELKHEQYKTTLLFDIKKAILYSWSCIK